MIRKILINFIGLYVFLFCFLLNCDPLVYKFDDSENANIYKAKNYTQPPETVQTLTIMTWNIRFGAAKTPWFGDSCGDRVILATKDVTRNLQNIADKINEIMPDILLIQEIDVESKRSGYIDQVQWLLDHTHLNYAAYASAWKAQYIPSDGLGRMDMGNAILSRWEITNSERIQLPLRGDQDALTQYFYLRRNILITKIALPGVDNFYAVNIHASAFSTDDTKKKHVDRFKSELDKLTAQGAHFIAGGDLNSLPPGSDKTYYCPEDACPDEDPEDKEGCDFRNEITWLQDLYATYQSAVPLAVYQANQAHYFTSTPDWTAFYDRKIDYLFTNHAWIQNSDVTHHEARDLSDHAPVSVKWEVPQ